MARLAGVPPGRAGLFGRFVYWFARRMVGKVPEPATIQAHAPAVLRAVAGFEFFVARGRLVPKRLKTLAALKAATQIGCPF